MTQKTKDEKQYPIKSLHDFLAELDSEWTKFRNGSLIGLASSTILFIIVVGIILRIRRIGLGFIDFILLLFAGVFLVYSIYVMYRQFRFFNRWERRVGLLLHLEEEMLEEKLSKENKAD
jgi:hypothetical protein